MGAHDRRAAVPAELDYLRVEHECSIATAPSSRYRHSVPTRLNDATLNMEAQGSRADGLHTTQIDMRCRPWGIEQLPTLPIPISVRPQAFTTSFAMSIRD